MSSQIMRGSCQNLIVKKSFFFLKDLIPISHEKST